MKSAIAGIALLAAASVAPIAASAAAADRTYDVRTRIVEQAPSVGEYDGLLALRVSAGGIVSGYYRPDDNPRFIPVTGGVSGGKFWIDIGTFAANPLRFSGTFSAGRIDAQANGFIVDDGRLTGLDLIGTPKPN
jgi:opacity protein-like surface antigen